MVLSEVLTFLKQDKWSLLDLVSSTSVGYKLTYLLNISWVYGYVHLSALESRRVRV